MSIARAKPRCRSEAHLGRGGPIRAVAASGTLAVILLTAALEGCAASKPPPPASASNLRLTAEEENSKRTLTAAERGDLLAAMRSVAVGAEIVDAPGPAPLGIRWSDVPQAVGAAAGAVDMWVVGAARIDNDPNRLRFELRTIEEWPALLLVTREPTDAVYSARAIIGPYAGAVTHTAREARLLEILDAVLHLLGERPRFAIPGDDPITGVPEDAAGTALAEPVDAR